MRELQALPSAVCVHEHQPSRLTISFSVIPVVFHLVFAHSNHGDLRTGGFTHPEMLSRAVSCFPSVHFPLDSGAKGKELGRRGTDI